MLARPVAAGLVRHARDWTGAKSHVDELGGGRMRAARPTYYFDGEHGHWPDEAELELAPPPTVAPEDADAWRAAVRGSLAAHEERARRDILAKDWKFLVSDPQTTP